MSLWKRRKGQKWKFGAKKSQPQKTLSEKLKNERIEFQFTGKSMEEEKAVKSLISEDIDAYGNFISKWVTEHGKKISDYKEIEPNKRRILLDNGTKLEVKITGKMSIVLKQVDKF